MAGALSSMDAVEELGSRNRRNGDGAIGEAPKGFGKLSSGALEIHKNACVDQERQGAVSIIGWCA